MKKGVLGNNILAIVTSVMLLGALCSCGETYVSGDNKCDICGKKPNTLLVVKNIVISITKTLEIGI